MQQNKRVAQRNSGRRFQKVKWLKERLKQRERELRGESGGGKEEETRERREEWKEGTERRGNLKMAKEKKRDTRRERSRTLNEWKEREQRAWDITSEMIHFLRARLQKETRRGRAEWLRGDETSRVSLLTLLAGPPRSPTSSTLVGRFAGSSIRANAARPLHFISWYLHWRRISSSYFTWAVESLDAIFWKLHCHLGFTERYWYTDPAATCLQFT